MEAAGLGVEWVNGLLSRAKVDCPFDPGARKVLLINRSRDIKHHVKCVYSLL